MSYLSDLLGKAYKEGMTEEEISAALETADQKGDQEMNRLKTLLSKANGEAAEYKRQLREKQTSAEAEAAAKQEEYDKMAKENADLKRSISLSEKKAKLIGMGYDETLATTTATAMVDNDMDTVMANQAKYLEAQKKNIKTEQMRGTPRPTAGSESVTNDYSKEIEVARANNDYSAMAYYTRLQGMEENALNNQA